VAAAQLRDACTHLDQVKMRELPASVDGCEDCLRDGGEWLHPRICLTRGHVGRCDESPNRHATAHHHATSHPIIRSLEPGEDWCWCYLDEVAFVLDGRRGATRIPHSPLLN
jgi:Zn-finger in ubiquitin-hydrolases and other protein